VRGYKLIGNAIGERLADVPLEIVGHLRFQLNTGMEVKSGPAPKANEVLPGRCIPEPKIVGKNADFRVIQILRPRCRRSANQHKNPESKKALHGLNTSLMVCVRAHASLLSDQENDAAEDAVREL